MSERIGGLSTTASPSAGDRFVLARSATATSQFTNLGIKYEDLAAAIGAGTGGAINAISAGTTLGSIGTIHFSNSNGVTFGMDANTITASVQTNYQAPGAYLTTAMQSDAGSNFVQAGAAFAGTNASGTIASNGISVSVAAAIPQTAFVFSNSNGVSFGTNGSTVTATVVTSYQPAGAYLTTAALSNHSHGNPQLNLTNLSGTTASNSAGFTLSLSAAAPGGGGLTNINVSAGTTSNNMSAMTFSNANGVSFGLNGSVITGSVAAAGGAQTGISGIQVSDTTYTVGTVEFKNANGISFGSSGANGVSASYTVPNVPAQTVQPVAASGSNGSFLFSTLSHGNLNGLSFYTSNGSIVGSYTVPSVPAQTVQPVAVSGQNGSYLFSTLSLSNANGISFGSSGASAITASHNALTSQSNQQITAGNGGFTFQTLSFSNLNGISFGTSAGSAITASHNALTTARASNDGVGLNTALTAGPLAWTVNSAGISLNAGSAAGTTTGFAGANISGSITHNTAGINLSLSVAAPGGGGAINVSAGTTSNNLQTIVFSNSNGVSFGLNGSTVTASAAGGNAATLLYYPAPSVAVAVTSYNSGTTGGTGGSTQVSAAMRFGPMQLPQNLAWTRALLQHSAATVSGTGSATVGYFAGIYTLNAGTAFSLLTGYTSQAVMVMSQNSVTARTHSWWWGTNSTSNSSSLQGNVSASFTASRMMLGWTGGSVSLSAGEYWIMQGHTARTSGVNLNSSSGMAVGNQLGSSQTGFIGQSSIDARSLALPWVASFSTTTNQSNTGLGVFPASIHTSAFTTVTTPSAIPIVLLNGIST